MFIQPMLWILYKVPLWSWKRCRVVCNMCFSREKRQFRTIIQKGGCCSNWKKALEKFRKHESSHCHLEASTMSVIWETHEDIGEMFSDTLSQEKFENRQILLKIFENVRFLCRQGLPLRVIKNRAILINCCCILQKLIAE